MKLCVIEERDAPPVPRCARWTRLYIHGTPTADDQKALDSFKYLADVMARNGYTMEEKVLAVVRVEKPEPDALLPCLVNGKVYEGLSAVQGYVDAYARRPQFYLAS